MKMLIKKSNFPVKVFIKGNINQIQYSWHIEPLLSYINTLDLHNFFIALKHLIYWSEQNNVICAYEAPPIYRLAMCFLP